MVLFTLAVMVWMCGFQLRSFVDSIPRYLAFSTLLRTWPLREYLVLICFLFLETVRTWHLLMLNDICQFFSQHSSGFKSSWSMLESLCDLILQKSIVLSANSLTWDLMFLDRSLM